MSTRRIDYPIEPMIGEIQQVIVPLGGRCFTVPPTHLGSLEKRRRRVQHFRLHRRAQNARLRTRPWKIRR